MRFQNGISRTQTRPAACEEAGTGPPYPGPIFQSLIPCNRLRPAPLRGEQRPLGVVTPRGGAWLLQAPQKEQTHDKEEAVEAAQAYYSTIRLCALVSGARSPSPSEKQLRHRFSSFKPAQRHSACPQGDFSLGTEIANIGHSAPSLPSPLAQGTRVPAPGGPAPSFSVTPFSSILSAFSAV